MGSRQTRRSFAIRRKTCALEKWASGQRRVAARQPLQDGGADIGERAVVAAPAVPLEARQQRRVLARVVGARRGRVAPVIGGDDQQIVGRIQALQPRTDLNVYRMTSAVELYGADGRQISRFALNLPDYASAPHQAAGCEWAVVDEVSPFGSSERRVLRASRAVCDGDDRPLGSILVRVMLDPATLPFISTQDPYLETVRPAAGVCASSRSIPVPPALGLLPFAFGLRPCAFFPLPFAFAAAATRLPRTFPPLRAVARAPARVFFFPLAIVEVPRS